MTVPTLTQHRTSSSQAGTAMALAFSGAVAAGDLLIADNWIGFEPGTTVISDTVNGTYTQDRNQILAGDQDQTFVASFVGSGSGTPTVSTSNPNSGWCGLAISDWAPGAGNTWSAAAQKTSANATSTSPNSGSITTTTATALIHTAVGFQPNAFTTSSAGSTTLQDVVKDPGAANTWLANGSQLVTSISSYAGTLSLSASDEWAAIVVAYPYTTSGGTTYNLSISESGATADAITIALVAANAVTESGTAADVLANALIAANAVTAVGSSADAIASNWIGSNALTEAGSAADSTTGGLVLANSVSESGSAADTVTGTPAYLNTVAEAGSAADATANSLTAANVVAEAGSAADALSTALIAVNSVSEAGSAADAVSIQGTTYSLSITEAGSAADALANTLAAFGAVSEIGAANDALVPGGSFSVLIFESLNAADAIVADGGSGGPTPAGKHRKRYGVMDGWRLLLFDTKSDADTFKASKSQAKSPAKALKRIRTVEPVQIINVPELKRSLPPPQAARVDQMIKEKRFDQVARLPDIAAQYEAQAREAAEVSDVVQAHRQASIEHIQSIHQALKVLHEIRKLRRLQ